MSDKNSFFHAAFGTSASGNEPYLDKRVNFRRRSWMAFLNYFEGESMPPPLAEVLKKRLSANEKYEHVKDQDHLESYISDIVKAEHDVTVEEIPILATLDNVKVVVFKDKVSETAVTIHPDNQILGDYSNTEKPNGEVVLHMEGNVFTRMDPLVEDPVPKSTNENKVAYVEVSKENTGQWFDKI